MKTAKRKNRVNQLKRSKTYKRNMEIIKDILSKNKLNERTIL